jgi:hypothetical protein
MQASGMDARRGQYRGLNCRACACIHNQRVMLMRNGDLPG